jgi:sugar/nucleoside kinase (ribokinase family)
MDGKGHFLWTFAKTRGSCTSHPTIPNMSLTVAGTIAIDNVKTPAEEHRALLGGSAAYASLSAAFLANTVHMVGIVGRDFPAAHLNTLESRGVILSGVERSEGESFTWTGEYFDDLNTRTTHRVGLNVLEHWHPSVPAQAADSRICVLANMSPDNQLETLAQMDQPSFIMADTMDLWIEIANKRLHDMLRRVNLLVINESEACDFCETRNVVKAGPLLQAKGPAYVVIKLGEYGALLFGPEGQFFRCGAFPLADVADPTGAGDSFLGGMAGYLSSREAWHPTFSQLKLAVVHGSIMASFTCEAFSTKGLEAVTRDSFAERLALFHRYSHFEG